MKTAEGIAITRYYHSYLEPLGTTNHTHQQLGHATKVAAISDGIWMQRWCERSEKPVSCITLLHPSERRPQISTTSVISGPTSLLHQSKAGWRLVSNMTKHPSIEWILPFWV